MRIHPAHKRDDPGEVPPTPQETLYGIKHWLPNWRAVLESSLEVMRSKRRLDFRNRALAKINPQWGGTNWVGSWFVGQGNKGGTSGG
jgi:hypothetical protein